MFINKKCRNLNRKHITLNRNVKNSVEEKKFIKKAKPEKVVNKEDNNEVLKSEK